MLNISFLNRLSLRQEKEYVLSRKSQHVHFKINLEIGLNSIDEKHRVS